MMSGLLQHSGASEMIFMNCSLRSSRVTGPKDTVPITSRLVSSSTAALVSNRINDPSSRRHALAGADDDAIVHVHPSSPCRAGMASLTLHLG